MGGGAAGRTVAVPTLACWAGQRRRDRTKTTKTRGAAAASAMAGPRLSRPRGRPHGTGAVNLTPPQPPPRNRQAMVMARPIAERRLDGAGAAVARGRVQSCVHVRAVDKGGAHLANGQKKRGAHLNPSPEGPPPPPVEVGVLGQRHCWQCALTAAKKTLKTGRRLVFSRGRRGVQCNGWLAGGM